MRVGLIVLGLALGVLWVAGLVAPGESGSGVPRWMVWIDFAVSVASLLAAFAPEELPRLLGAAPIAFAVTLLTTWLVALAEGAPGGSAWWTFGLGVGYAALSFLGKPDPLSMTDGVEKRPTLPSR